MAVKTFTTETLTSADTNTYLANSGLVYVTSATIGTTVSSVVVSSAFSTTYDNYKIIISGGVASASVLLSCQLGSTVTGYYWAHNYATYAGVAGLNSGSNTANFSRIGLGTTSALTGNFDLINPFTAKNTVLNYFYVDPRSNGEAGAGGGSLIDTTSYTAFTIAPASGTITGGTITVYGYRKA